MLTLLCSLSFYGKKKPHCGVAQDMAPPLLTSGCLAISHREQGEQPISGVPAFSRPLCLSQPYSIFTHYWGWLPLHCLNLVSSTKARSGVRSLSHQSTTSGALPYNSSNKQHVHSMFISASPLGGFLEYHEHNVVQLSVCRSCITNTFIILVKIMSIIQKYELSKKHQKKWGKIVKKLI